MGQTIGFAVSHPTKSLAGAAPGGEDGGCEILAGGES